MFDQLFGTKDDRLEEYFYSILSYSFGLPDTHALKFGVSQRSARQKLPIKTTWVGNYIDSFSITGPALIPQFFMAENNSNVYTQLDRNIAVPRNQRYAFDFSQIQEGTLSGKLRPEGDSRLLLSDECRKILDIIYQSGPQKWNAIPLVYAEHGGIFAGTGIPDRIYLQLPTVREASESYRNMIMQNIAYVYQVSNYDHIEVQVQQDRATSSMNFQAYVKRPAIVEPEELMYPESTGFAEPHPKTEEIPQTSPQFPFDYYRSIGLIDDEGMVSMDTILGIMRVPATSELGMEYLLKSGQQ